MIPYISYGMNTNISEMQMRCPDAEVIGKVVVPNHRLVFRSFADVEESQDDSVEAVLWNITSNSEAALDILEGYPFLYTKKYIEVQHNNKIYNAMIYQMVDGVNDYSPPSKEYYKLLVDGYNANNLDLNQMHEAIGFVSVDTFAS